MYSKITNCNAWSFGIVDMEYNLLSAVKDLVTCPQEHFRRSDVLMLGQDIVSHMKYLSLHVNLQQKDDSISESYYSISIVS